ncbi:MAG TPA: phosphatase PAP2 family protein [Polyangiaceae bacterium]
MPDSGSKPPRRSWLARSTCASVAFSIAQAVAPAANAQGSENEAAPRLEWRQEWPRFRTWEYAATGVSLAGLATIVLFASRPEEASEYGNPFDASVRKALRAETRASRDDARFVGDAGFRFLNIYPYVDSLVVAGLVHWNSDVALQMTLIDTQAFAMAGFVSIGFERLLGRARPSARECRNKPDYERFCGADDAYSSLMSGHTAIAFAGAGLTCAHHTHLPLYGSRAADISACLVTVGMAAASGVARVVNDRHWASDIVLAASVGGVSGYLLPVWLHYGSNDAGRPRESGGQGLNFAVLPELGPERAAVRIVLVN